MGLGLGAEDGLGLELALGFGLWFGLGAAEVVVLVDVGL